jgi:SAM-dependent methyltransferase
MDCAGISKEEAAVRATRRALAFAFLKGDGLEIGAGNRPVLLPKEAQCVHGDLRDPAALETYFGDASSPKPFFLDAQTLSGIGDRTFDFVISAHVVEHLRDALGAIRHTLRVLRPGGVFMLVLPDKRFTYDHPRPVTPLAHLIDDERDGGENTVYHAYRDCAALCHDWGGVNPTSEQIELQVGGLDR